MRLKYLIVLLLITLTTQIYSQSRELRVSGNFTGTSFTAFAEDIESKNPVIFFYRPEWVEGITIDKNFDNALLSNVLSIILHGSDLHFYIDETGYIIISKKFAIKSRLDQQEDTLTYLELDTYSDYNEENESEEYQLFRLGSPSGDNTGNASLSGYVKNISTGEPVIGAVIKIDELQRGSMTNQYGYYSITVPKGDYNAQFSCLGMKVLSRQISIYASGNMDVDMKENLIPLGSITVKAEGKNELTRREIGLEKLSVRTIKLLPSSLGEADIIKTALLLPGVQTVGEGSSGFHVRGGSADQNLVLLYDAPVFNSSHFLGFFSSINSEIIKDISLYKGGIPAHYGGRISSILSIIPKDGNKKEIGGSGGISPATSNLMIEGPIIKDKTSFLVAGRSTYSNWMLKLLDETSLKDTRASFYDGNIRLVHEINKNNHINLSSYISHDSFKFNKDTVYSYNNSILSLNWSHVFSNKLFGVFSLNNSRYTYNISSEKDIYNSFELLHNINFTELKSRLTWYPGYSHQVEMGMDIARYSLTPGELRPLNDSSIVIATLIDRQNALLPALFISDEIKLTNMLTLNAGLRLSSFFATGPATVFDYHPDFSKSSSTIIDTSFYSSGQGIKKYFEPELRISLNYLFGAASSLKLNYNSTTQFIHQLSNTAAISPTDIWVLSDAHILPQKGKQVAIGFYTKLINKTIDVSIEGYYKTIDNMIDFKGGAKLLLNENIETDIINTIGRARGVELMIRKDKGRMNGWIGYTYSRTELKSDTPFIKDEVNKGEWFPANYDKPHDLSVVFNYIFSRRFSLSTIYAYSTGRPITYPIASYTYAGNNILHYSDRNKYRVPDYSRLDVSFTISGNLKLNKLAHSTLTFSVYNLLGRDNVYSIYFDKQNDLLQGYKLSVFARPIPSISYNFKF